MYATAIHVQSGHLPSYNPHHNPLPNGHATTAQNGNANQHHPPPQSNRPQPPAKEPTVVVGIPSVSIQGNQLVVGTSQSSSTRSYTPLKVLGDGSFGTVWLCDWHGTLPPNTPLSPMQCGAGARPEWAGKRLVAVKRMKKHWEGGWDECKKLKELESLRAIPFHPNIIPLYDFFLLPASKELYFVFESMEGNLYHLIKARKGRALAGGLVSSIFRQTVAGLHHIHSSGYFHRDMKPENVLVTTTGLFDYQSVSPVAVPNAPSEKDVVAIIKLADFGLARETKSKPPYTEYVSTRWYRAPEVLLLSREYSNPVDMWALGTIMAELVNLRPLFPGSGQIDQVARICEILGDPEDYGTDSRGRTIGGGKWNKGIKLAKAVGFAFPKIQPRDVKSLFDRTVPTSLIDCIADLLRYDPDTRLTSRQCLDHPYLVETTPRNNIPMPPGLQSSVSLPSLSTKQRNGISASTSQPSLRSAPTSQTPPPVPKLHHLPPPMPHLHPFPDASSTHRSIFNAQTLSNSHPKGSEYANDIKMHEYPSATWPMNGHSVAQGGWAMDISRETNSPSPGQPMGIHPQDYRARHPTEPESITPSQSLNGHEAASPQSTKLGKLGSLGFGKKTSKWGLSMFGHTDKSNHLPPVEEMPVVSVTTSLKRTVSSSTDSRSLSDLSPVNEPPRPVDLKKVKKEAERMQREADKQRRALAEKMQREQARAVMKKRHNITTGHEHIEWKSAGFTNSFGNVQRAPVKNKPPSSGPIRQNQGINGSVTGSSTIDAAAGRFTIEGPVMDLRREHDRDERVSKVRRRDFDDDYRSSSDVHSIGAISSSLSFATNESHGSDPGPSRIQSRPSLFGGMSRMTSTSSLRTSFDDFSFSARSSNSFTVENQLASDFYAHATMDRAQLSASVSPPPLQMLSLSPSLSPTATSSPPWISVQHAKDDDSVSSLRHAPFITIPSPMPQHTSHMISSVPQSPYSSHGLSHSPYGHTPSPGAAPKSAINPIFKVVSLFSAEGGFSPDKPAAFLKPPLPLHSDDKLPSANTLPPFSHLEAVAEGEYPPMSPVSFHSPKDS